MAIQTNSPQSRNPALTADLERAVAAQRPSQPQGKDTEKAAVVTRDPAAMMADMAEELGFIVAEATGGSDEVDDDQDAAFDDLISDLIRKSMEQAQKVQQVDVKQDVQTLREEIVRSGSRGRPGQGLDDLLRRFSGGSSQIGLALVAQLVELAKTDRELQQLGFGQGLLEEYTCAHEAGLTAALNISEVLAAGDSRMPDTAERMLSTYENSIAASQSVLQTFQRLGQAEGISNVSDWREFLTEAVAADLSKQSSSTEKVQLQLILLELKGFRTFNTLTQGLERLAKTIAPKQEKSASELLQTTLNYIEQPLRELPNFENMAEDLPLQNQILFFQGFRNLLKSIPDDAYTSAEQKSGSLVPLQKRVDDLTWSEEV